MKTALILVVVFILAFILSYDTPAAMPRQVAHEYSVDACVGDVMQERGVAGVTEEEYERLVHLCK